jgi:hypothetical protein
MSRANQFSLIAIASLLVLGHALATAAEQPPASPDVKPASFERSAKSTPSESVRFTQRAARIGDVVDQTLALEMRMSTTVRRGANSEPGDRTVMRNAQHRTITTTQADAGRAIAVRVQYLAATKQVIDAAAAPENQSKQPPAATPVAGKTYLCARKSGENARLTITYENGQAPPTSECDIVAEHMDMVGRGSPLADFLHGKTVRVGDSLEVPREAAAKIFNLTAQADDVQNFKLTLQKIERDHGRARAIFLAQVDAASSNASQMRMQMEGTLTVEADTCRTANVDLTGPIAMSETYGSYSNSYQAISTGQLKSRLASTFHDAKR